MTVFIVNHTTWTTGVIIDKNEKHFFLNEQKVGMLLLQIQEE